MLLSQAIDEFLLYLQIERNYSQNTLDSYEYDLKTLQDFLVRHNRSLQLDDLIPSIIRRYIQEMVQKYELKPRTMARKISCLKSLSRYCLKERFIAADFMAGIETLKQDKKLPVYMSLSELKKLFHFLEQNQGRFALRNHLMFKLLASTGMRRQELVDLTWQQVNFDNMTIKVFGKGKKERLLPLHPIIHQLFMDYRDSLLSYQIHPEEPIFRNKNGDQLNARGLHKIFKETLEKAGLPPKRFSLHHLRHTFATLLLQENKENIDIRTLQELLGHESLATTSVYTHVDFEQKRKAINSFKLE
ncbi:tyrosine-type recombinase/integrase [Mesobacillus maritimus]|uniref:tyrosine-type recombinase/integrase n=1 Tax=Mesobacillus maritimus TaxID=1643336 RepID=UPI00203B8861|nr:tyrosine-type recombinase/integrase [Mesobacillus maritimus]MCM3584221.1 tyrosine-type recombinase/integrase [Mesobacillus maritimus]